MSQKTELDKIKVFARQHDFILLRGYGPKSNLYTVARRIGALDAPRCPYMEPELLSIWIDGYRMGLIAASPNRAEE